MARSHFPRSRMLGVLVLVVVLGGMTPVEAGSHLWRFNEIFSNADGTIQFVELKECCGAAFETGLFGKWVRSDTTGNQFDFMTTLRPPTSNRHLLLATEAFAALPGAPTPDFIIPEQFFDLTQDELTYWLYSEAFMIFGPGDLPTDGVASLAVDGTTATNSPTNYAGDTGSVVVPCNPADVDGSGGVDFLDLLAILSSWGPCAGCAADVDGSRTVDFLDLLAVLAAWGPCE
ncbi:MAG: hypothetical protein HKO59_06020 [Phycisphaerales bacterium]|nr:hypothetical protein [Phycisphaerae bacterium]NNF41913.1 hypothetical protein [Phycisphaerales bacterium]NNM25529.1 hypothetical protein [Phycisphaerales bacterium]